MKKRLILVLAVMVSAIAPAFTSDFRNAEEGAAASSAENKCAIPRLTDAYRQSSAVFVGEVTKEEKNGDVRSFELAVESYWKGPGRKKIRIDVYETARYQAWFKVGEKYLIYADAGEKKGSLSVGRCSRSREFTGAADDLKQLGKGKRPR